MLFVLQNILYCGLYILLVKCAAKNSCLNCLYFYPDEYIEEAHKRKIADKEATMKKGSKIWIILGMEDVSYAKPWSYMLKRRTLGTIMYLVVALAIAGIVVLIGKI